MKSGLKTPNYEGALQILLRQKIAESAVLRTDIARACGISPAVIGRFLRKEQTIRLDGAEALCQYFGITFVQSTQQ